MSDKSTDKNLLGRRWTILKPDGDIEGAIFEYNGEIVHIEGLEFILRVHPIIRTGINANWVLNSFFPSIGWKAVEGFGPDPLAVAKQCVEPSLVNTTTKELDLLKDTVKDHAEDLELLKNKVIAQVLEVAQYVKEIKRLNDRLNEVFQTAEKYRDQYIKEKETNKQLRATINDLLEGVFRNKPENPFEKCD